MGILVCLVQKWKFLETISRFYATLSAIGVPPLNSRSSTEPDRDILEWVAVLRAAVRGCCSVLQRVAVCCNVPRCVAVLRAAVLRAAVCESYTQSIGARECVTASYSALQCVTVCCSALQCVTVCYSVLHSTAARADCSKYLSVRSPCACSPLSQKWCHTLHISQLVFSTVNTKHLSLSV